MKWLLNLFKAKPITDAVIPVFGTCGSCMGRGGDYHGWDFHWWKCDRCNGTGKINKIEHPEWVMEERNFVPFITYTVDEQRKEKKPFRIEDIYIPEQNPNDHDGISQWVP